MQSEDGEKVEIIDSRLEDSEGVLSIVDAVVKEYVAKGEEQEEAEDAKVDQRVAAELKKRLDKKTGNVWSVIVGSKFSLSAGQHKDDQYAQFKAGRSNIVLLETKLKRA